MCAESAFLIKKIAGLQSPAIFFAGEESKHPGMNLDVSTPPSRNIQVHAAVTNWLAWPFKTPLL